MADNIKIAYVVDKSQLIASNKELDKTVKANNLTQKEVKETTDKFKDQDKQLSKTNKAFSSMGDQLKALGNRFTIAGKGVGDMASGLLTTAKGAGTASKAMKVLKIALAATGIGLLVVALGSLATFLTKNQEGADKLSKVMRVVGVVFDVVIDRVGMLGKGLVQFFSGNYSESFETLKGAVSGVGEEMRTEGKAALQLERDTQKLRDANIAFIVTKGKLRIAIEASRLAAEEEQRSGETLEESNKRRAKASQDAINATNELSRKEIELAKEKSRLLSIEVGLGESLTEDIRADEEAKVAVLELEAQRLTSLKRLVAGMNRFTDATKESTEATREKIEIDEVQAEAIADKDPLEALIGITGDQMMEGIAMVQEGNEAINESNLNRSLLEISQFKSTAEAKEMIAFGLADSLAIIAGKGSAVAKAVALADIAYGTGKGFIQALDIAQKGAAGTGPLAPFTFPVFFATQLAAVFGAASQAKSILSTPAPKFEHGGRVGGNLHSGGGTMIEAELDEHVMSRKATSKYGHGFFKALNNLELSPDVLSGLSGGSAPIIINSDNKELINEYRNRPILNLDISENGITKRTQRNNSIIQKKVLRYKS